MTSSAGGPRVATSATLSVFPAATIGGWEDGFLIVRDGPLCIRLSGRFLDGLAPHLKLDRDPGAYTAADRAADEECL